ncbi:transposase InsO family protein [Naumannella halotolerans]|uniref:Transposase InsO family protein n=3 Tax=Naumannella halotolerans TaxID=993414 RepID=A0A4R7IX73_9ACTN|nr:transposase InsO family protein [Naumannella halotolerans]
MIAYIEAYRDQFGVEPICAALAETDGGFITARGYRAAKTRPASTRMLRDQELGEVISRLHADNYGVYGVRKMHALLRRKGWLLGRDQTGRIMRQQGLHGVRRGKRIFTTRPDPAGQRPADLVQRRFVAARPNRLWVADLTFVPTWSGMAYVAFVTDVFSRRIVGWSVRSTMTTEALPLEALQMATWNRGELSGLTHHSDRGSQYVSLRYTDTLAELGIAGSVGSVGDSYDNALAETINGLYKTELIRQRRPWKTVEQVELATLEYVWWFNHRRLHSELSYRTPIEVEAAYYEASTSTEEPDGSLEPA